MKGQAAVWAFGLVILLAVGWSTATGWSAGRDGQIVFRPVDVLDDGGGGLDAGADLVIDSCTPGDGGLIVRGQVSPGPTPRVVLVSGADRTVAGRRIGMAHAAQTNLGSDVGQFTVTLPWATDESSFALAGLASGAVKPHGPRVGCP